MPSYSILLTSRRRIAKPMALVLVTLALSAGVRPAAAADYFIEAVVFAWSDVDSRETRERWKIGGRKPAPMPAKAKSPADNPAEVSDRRLLDQSIAQLVQRGGVAMLKHQAWTQLRAGRSGSPQVVFDQAGATKLSGWIRVYDSTLLYAEVDLALFDENAVSPIMAGNQSSTGLARSDDLTGEISRGVPAAGQRTPGVVNRGGVTVTTDANGNVTFSNQSGASEQAGSGEQRTVYEDLSPGETYRINERRRIKFNEIHYIDHPKFGVLLTITRDEQS